MRDAIRSLRRTYLGRRLFQFLVAVVILAVAAMGMAVFSAAAGAQQLPETALPDPPKTEDKSNDGIALPLVAGIALATLAIGAGGGWFFARSKGSSQPRPLLPEPTGTAPPRSESSVGIPVGEADSLRTEIDRHRVRADGANSERATLVRALIDAIDTATSDAVRTQAAQQLAAVGVVAVEVAPGTAFDPARQRGVHGAPAARPEDDGIVASCDRVGWADRDTLIRPPEVVVFRWEQQP